MLFFFAGWFAIVWSTNWTNTGYKSRVLPASTATLATCNLDHQVLCDVQFTSSKRDDHTLTSGFVSKYVMPQKGQPLWALIREFVTHKKVNRGMKCVYTLKLTTLAIQPGCPNSWQENPSPPLFISPPRNHCYFCGG